MTFAPKPITGKIGIKARLVFKNKAGTVVKVMDLDGAVPISKLGMTEDQAREFVQQHQQQQEKS